MSDWRVSDTQQSSCARQGMWPRTERAEVWHVGAMLNGPRCRCDMRTCVCVMLPPSNRGSGGGSGAWLQRLHATHHVRVQRAADGDILSLGCCQHGDRVPILRGIRRR